MQLATTPSSHTPRGSLARAARLVIPLACVLAVLAFTLTAGAASAHKGAPSALAGVWHHRFPGNVDQHIAFRGSRFLVYVTPSDVARMRARFHGARVTFYGSNTCPGAGTYKWSVKHGVLRFKLIGADPCHRAQLLPRTAWRRP